MDTSTENILMAEKATEIQNLRSLGQNKAGDWFLVRQGNRWGDQRLMITSDNDIRKIPDGAIWLPRQDQLQSMVFGGLEIGEGITLAMLTLLYEYGHVINNKTVGTWNTCKTMEQLWLVFVMWELYQKRWDGKDWVKV